MGPSDEADAPAPGVHQMLSGDAPGSPVVDAHDVEFATLRIVHDVAVKEHYWDLGITEHRGNYAIDGVLVRVCLDGCEEHSRDAVRNQSDANFFRVLFGCFRTRE